MTPSFKEAREALEPFAKIGSGEVPDNADLSARAALLRYGCEGRSFLSGELYYPVFDQPDRSKNARIIALCELFTDAERICKAMNAEDRNETNS